MFFGGVPTTFSSTIQPVGYRHVQRQLHLRPASSSSQPSPLLTEKDNEEPVIIPKVPLCERPPAYSAQLASVLAWREDAVQQAALAGTKWAAAGEADAPSVEDLHTELSWLLDDSVAGVRTSSSAAWQQKSWRDIERTEAVAGAKEAEGAAEIHLRESLEELGTLIKLSIDNIN